MKLNITPGPWTYTMPRPEKFYAKISGKGWSDFAKVCVRTMDDESAIIEEQQGKDNVIAIITAVQNTYHKGINPEAVPEMLEFLAAIARHPKNDTLADFLIDDAKKLIQKSTL